MVYDHRYGHFNEERAPFDLIHIDAVRRHLDLFSYAVHSAANLPTRAADWTHRYFSERSDLLFEIERLRYNNLILNSELQKLVTFKNENRHLRRLLQSPADTRGRKVAVAKLVGVNLAPFEQQIVIDKGSNHGVYPGQPVLDVKGVIGQVSTVTPLTADVTLISNPGHALLGQIDRSRLRMLVLGTGNPRQLKLEYVPTTADIRAGDIIYTSGLDNRYPGDYPVGEVLSIHSEVGDDFAVIHAKPLADLIHSREMLLIWPEDAAAQAQAEAATEAETETPADAAAETPAESGGE